MLSNKDTNRAIDIESDNWGKEPYLGKNPEPQYQKTEPEHYDFWGQKEGIENPLDRVSHQSNLRNIFGDKHSE
jgi:hypothetical protein